MDSPQIDLATEFINKEFSTVEGRNVKVCFMFHQSEIAEYNRPTVLSPIVRYSVTVNERYQPTGGSSGFQSGIIDDT
ncbi:MAG: hypothetical protein ACJAWL_001114 [Motiliproteus sp.]|jgi:hypothetical protein